MQKKPIKLLETFSLFSFFFCVSDQPECDGSCPQSWHAGDWPGLLPCEEGGEWCQLKKNPTCYFRDVRICNKMFVLVAEAACNSLMGYAVLDFSLSPTSGPAAVFQMLYLLIYFVHFSVSALFWLVSSPAAEENKLWVKLSRCDALCCRCHSGRPTVSPVKPCSQLNPKTSPWISSLWKTWLLLGGWLLHKVTHTHNLTVYKTAHRGLKSAPSAMI